MRTRIIPSRFTPPASVEGSAVQPSYHEVALDLLAQRDESGLTRRELFDAQVERLRKAAEICNPPAIAVPVAAIAPDDSAPWAGILARSQARREEAQMRFSPAIDAEPERVCDHHLGTVLALDRESTLDRSRREDSYRPVFARCAQCEWEEREDRRWRHAKIPERVLRATLDNFQTPDTETADALATARQFSATAYSRGGFFFLLGRTGTGKGHLATGAAKTICPRGDVVFIAHADLLTQLRNSYSTGETERFIERLRTVPVLILDEYGVSSGGRDEAPVLYQILATRHDRRKPTILTSNEELDKLRELLGFRLLDRMREDFALVNLTGPSWRVRSPLP